MFDPCKLLSYEYFPVELPPCFQSISLANEYPQFIKTASCIAVSSIPLTYSGYKSETSRRKFAIPNPCQYSRAVALIVENEAELQKVFSSSVYSLTAPIDRKPLAKQPYAKRSNSIADTKQEIEYLYQNHRFEIRLDINSFFDSIYTHTIAVVALKAVRHVAAMLAAFIVAAHQRLWRVTRAIRRAPADVQIPVP